MSASIRASENVLRIPAFRKLWNAMSFSSFGDWLGLLATTALAQQLAGGDYATANFAIAGVFIARLLPSVILGPIAGVIADRFDRKKVMVIGDLLRAGLFISIPLVGTYVWLYIATVLVECVTLFWSPAKEATVPNLVPKNRLESVNQISLLAAYGTAPIAAGLFSILSIFYTAISETFELSSSSAVDLALYINALSFLFSAITIYTLDISKDHIFEVPSLVPRKEVLLMGLLDFHLILFSFFYIVQAPLEQSDSFSTSNNCSLSLSLVLV